MINFLRYRFICGFSSVLVMVACIVGYFYLGGFRYSVDFTGGTQVLLGFEKKVSSEEVKTVLEKAGFGSVALREFSEKELLVRVQEFANDAKGVGERIKGVIEKEIPENQVTILSTDGVGAGVGAELRTQSTKAIIIGLLLMLLYIAIRFQFAFAVGAVVAIFHDALAILAVFLFFNKEISIDVIGAILAMLGYSINDTIVIFARIRENMKLMHNASLTDIVNTSINQTLRRTILTSFSTALTVIALLLFGGETLRDLSLALLIGIVVGTYSSIYIASAVMLLLYKDNKKKATA